MAHLSFMRLVWFKFGSLVVGVETAKLKSANIIYTQFGAKPPNLKTTNIFGYMVVGYWSEPEVGVGQALRITVHSILGM